MTIHGDTRNDEYYWMRDRENPEVIDYLNSENAYREQIMKGTEKLQERLYEEIVGRIKKDDSSVPYLLDGYYYYTDLKVKRSTRSIAVRKVLWRLTRR